MTRPPPQNRDNRAKKGGLMKMERINAPLDADNVPCATRKGGQIRPVEALPGRGQGTFARFS
jgi:hypothetical protein